MRIVPRQFADIRDHRADIEEDVVQRWQERITDRNCQIVDPVLEDLKPEGRAARCGVELLRSAARVFLLFVYQTENLRQELRVGNQRPSARASSPKRSETAAAREAAGSLLIRSRTSTSVPTASFCIDWATFFELRCSCLKTAF